MSQEQNVELQIVCMTNIDLYFTNNIYSKIYLLLQFILAFSMILRNSKLTVRSLKNVAHLQKQCSRIRHLAFVLRWGGSFDPNIFIYWYFLTVLLEVLAGQPRWFLGRQVESGTLFLGTWDYFGHSDRYVTRQNKVPGEISHYLEGDEEVI